MNTHQQKANKVIFLFGPTAVGKTDLLCSFFCNGFEVINSDSVQVYKGLDIGSAKADKSVTDIIPHHLIDILQPYESFNVAEFIEKADILCAEIQSRGNIPVISGGTAFYFKNFMYGLSKAPQADLSIRKQVTSWIEEVGLKEAHEYLKSVDSVSALRINVNDSYRISRAIEVYRQTGKPLSSFEVPKTIRNNMQILSIGLFRPKDELDMRIRQRVDIMFNDGLVNEIKTLKTKGAGLKWQSMQAIGYKEFFTRLDENHNFSALDLDKIKEEIIMNSIHYAKRQMTFFRSLENVNWVNAGDKQTISKLVDNFLN